MTGGRASTLRRYPVHLRRGTVTSSKVNWQPTESTTRMMPDVMTVESSITTRHRRQFWMTIEVNRMFEKKMKRVSVQLRINNTWFERRLLTILSPDMTFSITNTRLGMPVKAASYGKKDGSSSIARNNEISINQSSYRAINQSIKLSSYQSSKQASYLSRYQSINQAIYQAINQSIKLSRYQSSKLSSYQSSKLSIEISINQSINQASKLSIEISINQSINQASYLSRYQSINQAIEISMNQAIELSINQSSYRDINQASKQAIDRDINQSINQSSKLSIEISINQSSYRDINESSYRAINQASYLSRYQSSETQNSENETAKMRGAFKEYRKLIVCATFRLSFALVLSLYRSLVSLSPLLSSRPARSSLRRLGSWSSGRSGGVS